jgi:hypothetical protein
MCTSHVHNFHACAGVDCAGMDDGKRGTITVRESDGPGPTRVRETSTSDGGCGMAIMFPGERRTI